MKSWREVNNEVESKLKRKEEEEKEEEEINSKIVEATNKAVKTLRKLSAMRKGISNEVEKSIISIQNCNKICQSLLDMVCIP